ncbi:MAG TPA: ABC transporter permease [Vicinamibacterales bacterium]|nr:ABC transporter permease [Vicinamibacterales bacterium]
MESQRNWKALVVRQAQATGAGDLPRHTIDELAAHLEDIYADALKAGRTEADAYRAAEAALLESAAALPTVPRPRTRRPDARPPQEIAAGGRITGIGGDLRFAWRQWKRSPSFAAVAILTLGLGAGAATAIFSIVDTVLLRPLPFREPDRLVTIWETNAEKGLPRERLSPVNFMDYRATQSAFSDAAAWWRPEINLAEPRLEPIRVSTIETSANLFDLLGVSTQLGPGFPQQGPFNSRDLIAVISDRLWRQRYSADPSVIGKPIEVNNGSYTIAGVMPPRFNFPDDVDLWLRLSWDYTLHSRGAHFTEAVARLQPGITVEQAARELEQVSARLAGQAPSTNGGWIARPIPLLDDMLGYYRPALIVLLAAVGLVLLTACLNVAGLLLARATARAREMAVRAALGASRARLVRQMLLESLLLAGAGTAAGAVAAIALLKGAIALLPASVPRLAQTTVDVRLLVFALAVVASTALVFGLVPALVTASARASEALKDSTRTSTGVRGHRISRVLVVAEVALACAVLVASALLVRSVTRMMNAPTGIIADGVVTATLQLENAKYPAWANVEQFYALMLEAVRRQPGIEAAGLSTAIVLQPGWRIPVAVDGRPAPRPEEAPIVQHVSVSSGYFETFRVRLLDGRLLQDSDTATAEPVIVVNETLAKRLFPGESTVGKRLISTAQQIGPLGRNLMFTSREVQSVPFRIVGVVSDVHQAPIGQAAEPVLYHSQRQFPFRAMTVVARGQDTATVVTGIRQALRGIDSAVALSNVRTMEERLITATAAPRLLTGVLVTFAVLTGLLAAIGVYGLLAWTVNERRRELAIRLALGAQPLAVARLVAVHGLALTAGGILLGLGGAQLAGGLLQDVLFQTRTTDVLAMSGAAALLIGAAVLACIAPARRAARVAPVEGMREC